MSEKINIYVGDLEFISKYKDSFSLRTKEDLLECLKFKKDATFHSMYVEEVISLFYRFGLTEKEISNFNFITENEE